MRTQPRFQQQPQHQTQTNDPDMDDLTAQFAKMQAHIANLEKRLGGNDQAQSYGMETKPRSTTPTSANEHSNLTSPRFNATNAMSMVTTRMNASTNHDPSLNKQSYITMSTSSVKKTTNGQKMIITRMTTGNYPTWKIWKERRRKSTKNPSTLDNR